MPDYPRVVVGGVNVKQIEVDFSDGDTEKEFIVVDADVSASNQIIAEMSKDTPTGKDTDEVEMDTFEIKCIPGAGQFNMFIRSLEGMVHDKFKVNYLVG